MTPETKILTLQSALSDLLIAVQNRKPSLGELAVATIALASTEPPGLPESCIVDGKVCPVLLGHENARIAAERSRVWQSTRTPPMEARA